MKEVLFLTLRLAAILVFADARYIFEVQVLRFSNPDNEDFNGGCCDPFCGTCDVYFIFCIRSYQFSPSTSNLPCTFGTIGTSGNPITTSFRTFTVGQDIVESVPNPLVFTGNAWPGEFQFTVRVVDSDPDSDDLLDRVILDRRLQTSSSFTSTISQLGFYGKVTMQFRLRAMCEPNYFGSDCTVFCAPQDSDTLGHFTCDSSGRPVCLDGYSGQDCLTPECTTGCQGTCSRPNLCDRCDPGFSGPLCSICDELAPGCVVDHAFCVVPGECRCNPGYSGTLCQIDDDVCGHQTPCLNGGSCSNAGPDAHVCACPEFYTGVNCDVEIDMCNSSPCLNGATCEPIPSSFTCTCGPGWTGQTCNINIDECAAAPSPCLNGGTCTDCVPTLVSIQPPGTTSPQDSCPRGYTCECPEGFFGDDCEVDVDFCESSPCQNNGTCHDVIGGPGYNCTCPSGYTGINCEEDIDECAEGICENGGTCTNLEGSFNCYCPPGFTGDRCETDIDECASSPCYANSTLNCEDRIDAYSCSCIPGYTGVNCEEIINMCEMFSCLNEGVCAPAFNDFTCVCPFGFSGPECNIDVIDDCHPDFCLFGGLCIDQVDGYTCECPLGHTGRQCEIEEDPCFLNPCPSNTPICTRTVSGGVECSPCISTEAGCQTPLAQGGNGTEPEDTSKVGGIVGGVVGGVVAALLLLLLILLVTCCCCRNWCCCCCGAAATDKEEDIETQDHAQNNPLYFGVNTLVSSTGGSMPRYKPPGYVQTNIDHGYTALSPDSPSFVTTEEPHYEHIPAQLGNGAAIRESAMASGSYNHFLDKPVDDCGAQRSGKYDKKSPTPENPYTMRSSQYEMGPEAMARRDMYTLLPTPDELREQRDD